MGSYCKHKPVSYGCVDIESGYISDCKATFRKHLNDLDIEFDFINGPIESTPAPGVDIFYEPPYYSFWKVETLEDIQKARQWLLGYIAQHGPYDAVLAFSQGCALALSTLLLHTTETPHLPLPFKAAVFICGGPPFSVAESVGYVVKEETKTRDLQSRKDLGSQASTEAILAKGADRWDGSKKTRLSDEELRAEIQGPVKIDIPTVHIYGDKDPRYAAGVHLSAFFSQDKVTMYNHEGGHDIPRKDAVSRKIALLVTRAFEEADLI